MLHEEPQVGDGYSSDNSLFYGTIRVSTKSGGRSKSKYLEKLGKEILKNDAHFLSDSAGGFDRSVTKKLNEEENAMDIVSDDSTEKIQRAESHRKEVIRARYVIQCTDSTLFLF